MVAVAAVAIVVAITVPIAVAVGAVVLCSTAWWWWWWWAGGPDKGPAGGRGTAAAAAPGEGSRCTSAVEPCTCCYMCTVAAMGRVRAGGRELVGEWVGEQGEAHSSGRMCVLYT